MPYIGRTKDVKVRQQRIMGDGTQKIFTLDFVPHSDNQLACYLDGTFLNDQDWVFKHPNKIVLADAPGDGTELVIVAPKATDIQSRRHKLHIADNIQRIFDCGFIPPNEYSVLVTVNGEVQQDRDYVLSGSKVILNIVPSLNAEVEIRGIYDIIDPTGQPLASNNLAIRRTREKTDGYQNIIPMHQYVQNENNVIVCRGSSDNGDAIVSNQREYLITSGYKYVHNDVLSENTEIEFRNLQEGVPTQYDNLCRRVIMTKDFEGVPATVTLGAGGTSGYTSATNVRAYGGSGEELYVDIVATGGVVTSVSISNITANHFSREFQTSEALNIYQAGSTNDATVVIATVTNNDGQRYFDINNTRWDPLDNNWLSDTGYSLTNNEYEYLVSVDGIIQPYNTYTNTAGGPGDPSGANITTVDIGSLVGEDENASFVEIRDIQRLVSDLDATINATVNIERIVWTTTGAGNTFDVTTGYTARTSDFQAAFNSNLSNEHKFLVIVNGIIQDRDTWTLITNHVQIGGTAGHSDDAVTGAPVVVELIFLTNLDSTLQDAKQVTMTGNPATGVGDHKFIRLYDRATGTIELHPDSESSVIIDIDGVLQQDKAYFVEKNKICFFDEAPQFGSNINVKVLKCTEVAAANRRKAMFRGDGSSVNYTLPFTSTTTPDDFGILVFVNGRMYRDNEYALTGTTLTFNTAPTSDAFVEVVGIFDITTFTGTSSDTDLETKKLTITCDGIRQIFDLGELVFEQHSYGTVQDTYNEQKLLVFLDGELKGQHEYVIIGNKLYLTSIPNNGNNLEVVRFI
jgi:hypothetical protein